MTVTAETELRAPKTMVEMLEMCNRIIGIVEGADTAEKIEAIIDASPVAFGAIVRAGVIVRDFEQGQAENSGNKA